MSTKRNEPRCFSSLKLKGFHQRCRPCPTPRALLVQGASRAVEPTAGLGMDVADEGCVATYARGSGGDLRNTPRPPQKQGDINESFSTIERETGPPVRAGVARCTGVGARQRRCGEEHRQHRELGDAGGGHVQPALLAAEADQHLQRRQDAGRLDLLHRRAARPRRLAAGDRRHDVHDVAVPEQGLRDQPRQPADRLEVRAQARPGGDPADVLRHGQPRRRLRRGQGDPAAGRQHARRARRQDRQGGLERQERRPEARRRQHQRAARLQGQGHHRHQRWRVGRARLHRGVQPLRRQAGLEGLQRRPRRRDADGPGQDDDLDRRQDGTGGRRLLAEDLEGRSVEARWRHDLGLVQLRQGAEPDVLRHRQPVDLEPGAAPRRQQVVDDHLRA